MKKNTVFFSAIFMLQCVRIGSAGYPERMEAGRRILRSGAGVYHNRLFIDFSAAAAEFQKAAIAAEDNEQKAAALLAMAESRLNDFRDTDYAGIRGEFERVLNWEDLLPPGRADAVLGIGETFLRELEYDRAREHFALVGEMAAGADFVSHLRMQSSRNNIRSWAAVRAQYALAFSYMQERRYTDAREEFERLLGMEELDRVMPPTPTHLKWRVEALLAGIEGRSSLRSARPRMFFNSDTWPVVRERALTAEKDYFDSMRERVEHIALETIDLADHGMNAMEAAFVYRVTECPELLEKVRKMLRASVDFYLGRTVSRGRMYAQVGFAAALDWVWNDLPAAERLELARDMTRYVHSMDVEDRVQVRQGLNHISYYVRQIPFFFGLSSLDEDLGDLEYARALTALGRGLKQYAGFQDDAITKGRGDGAIRTALEYYFAETPHQLWSFLYVRESAFGQPADAELVYFLSPDYVLRNILGFDPGLLHFAYHNSWNSRGGMWAQSLYDHLSQMIHFFGASHPEQAAIARHLRERMEQKGLTGRGQYPVYPFLLDLDRAPPAGIPEHLPIARHFEYAGQILMSSGFGPEDTYALFACGGGGTDPHSRCATHFSIYKQGFLALRSGTRAQDGSESSNNYWLQTVAHNAVLIHMAGEEAFVRGEGVNSGGQRRSPNHARVLAFESDRFHAYMATDATETYHEDKCAQMVRQFIFLPPDLFVVFDHVTSTDAEHPKTWLLHTANEPAISGNEFSAVQGEGKIFCRTLLPADAVLDKIGGPGKEFWAGGRNWPIPDGSPYFRTIGMQPGGEIPENIGRWRVGVHPGAFREEDHFLHVIQTADRAVVEMAESRIREEDGRVEVHIDAGEREYILTLNQSGAVGGHLRIVESGRTLIDRPLTDSVMPQTGLALQRDL